MSSGRLNSERLKAVGVATTTASPAAIGCETDATPRCWDPCRVSSQCQCGATHYSGPHVTRCPNGTSLSINPTACWPGSARDDCHHCPDTAAQGARAFV